MIEKVRKYRKHIFRLPEGDTRPLKLALTNEDIGVQHICEAVCKSIIESADPERREDMAEDRRAAVETFVGLAREIKDMRKDA